MVIKYYINPDLKYTSRKRHRKFDYEPNFQEEQRAVLLGDGATTTIKTSAEHICDYVTIDDTRWFVLYYTYMNGGQVTLYLQRDVFGEKGIVNCFGKVERGFTNTSLKNKKELGLNQILKSRKPIKPSTNTYGNYTVDNHDNEMWGVLYFVKPTGNDPSTGEPYPEQVNITIPSFSPDAVDYPFIPNNTKKNIGYTYNSFISFTVKINKIDKTSVNRVFQIYINFSRSTSGLGFSYSKTEISNIVSSDILVNLETIAYSPSFLNVEEIADKIAILVGQAVVRDDGTDSSIITIPPIPNIDDVSKNYNNVTVLYENKYYKYSVNSITENTDGETEEPINISHYIGDTLFGKSIKVSGFNCTILNTNGGSAVLGSVNIRKESLVAVSKYLYTYKELSPSESGQITISTNQQLIDEPYSILVFPLFNVTITGTKTYKIERDRAFQIFNTVIQYLSGENAYIVDAQIYPYCPVLTGVASELQLYPFFTIASTSYLHHCFVQLLPSSDVKKEYIERQYSIISPEQSGKFSFNFYDYKNKINNNNGINFEKIEIIIKTALKPFAIISSAVIVPDIVTPDTDSLIGITYSSDLRGCQPSGNGFECSLSSNAFETYKRQNSNYQQIFALQKEELINQQKIERANEIVSGVMNTTNAAMMGAIGGAAMGDTGILPFTKSVGAITGAAIGGTAVGAATAAQYAVNEWARKYELSLQQQRFDLEIGTIKNLPNSINRISSFNEIILQDFYFVIETYECSNAEKEVVDNFIKYYGYSIGVFDLFSNYTKTGWFLRGSLITSGFDTRLHMIAENELKGGIYLYE